MQADPVNARSQGFARDSATRAIRSRASFATDVSLKALQRHRAEQRLGIGQPDAGGRFCEPFHRGGPYA